MKLKKGDQVKVRSGKDKGKTGKVEKVYSKENKILVAGINEYKRHVKAQTQTQKSEIITIIKPLPLSAVSLVCPNCKKETRVGFKIDGDEKLRICRKCKKKI